MKITNIEAKTLPEAWFLCIKGLSAKDGVRVYTIDRGSFAGSKRLEYDLVTVRVEFPGSKPLVPTVPEGIEPPTSMGYVEEYYSRYVVGVRRMPRENYTYGEDIVPQIGPILDMLGSDPNTNQACMTLGDKNSVNLQDPQCLKAIDFRVSYGKLNVVVYFRSWDLWAGFPSNLAAIQLLKASIAAGLGVMDGELLAVSKGLHLYSYSWQSASMVIRSDLPNPGLIQDSA